MAVGVTTMSGGVTASTVALVMMSSWACDFTAAQAGTASDPSASHPPTTQCCTAAQGEISCIPQGGYTAAPVGTGSRKTTRSRPTCWWGGLGADYVEVKRDGYNDVVRVRGGGSDIVLCYFPDPGDVLFVDRTDRLGPSCKKALVLYTGRPRYPYP
jgi:hypothetical protein